MTALHSELSRGAPQAGTRALGRAAPALFALTLFLSALLLFAVQPMFTKMVLPRLGGAPAVWSVAMVFFQAALLVGYAYAHLLIRFLPLGIGAVVHLGVLAAAAMAMPIGIAQASARRRRRDIAFWLIALFAASIGLPFAALSASAPLLQGWFAATGHPHAGNPYVLYAASNLGSFAALIAYPVVIEPMLALHAQAQFWSLGFAAFAVLIAVASLFIVRKPSCRRGSVSRAGRRCGSPGLDRAARHSGRPRHRGHVLHHDRHRRGAVPLGVAAGALSVDVRRRVPRPPVAASRRPWRERCRSWSRRSRSACSDATTCSGRPWSAINLIAFFLLAMLCHGEVYRRRPAPARLTEFYLFVSLGGVIGGIFAALIAPHIFSRVYEYPILIVAGVSGAARESGQADSAASWPTPGRRCCLSRLRVAANMVFESGLPAAAELPFQIALVVLAATMLLQRHRPARFVSLVVLAFVLTGLWQPGYNRIETARSFFGVHQVVETADRPPPDPLSRHDHPWRPAAGRRRPAGEIAAGAADLLLFRRADLAKHRSRARRARAGSSRVAAVGLGTGSLACHRRGNEAWTFFEIDPEVVRIARDPRLFGFLVGMCARCPDRARRCPADARGVDASLRSHRDRCVLVGCDPGASADPRGNGRISVAA